MYNEGATVERMRVLNRGSATSKDFYCQPYKSSTLDKPKHYIVLDVHVQQKASEIGGWKKMNDLKISIVTVYCSKKDSVLVFKEEDIPSLIELCYKRVVVGYGIKRIDLIVLAAYGLDITKCKFFDMMVNLEAQLWGPFLKLNSVLLGTLNKTLEFNPVELYKEENMDELVKLGTEHVEMIHELFVYGKTNSHIIVKEMELVGEDEDKKEIEVENKIPVSWKMLVK